MPNSIAKLTALSDRGDPYNIPWGELEPLWVDAANQRFQECRGRIRILDQLAESAGIDEIRRLDDLVPLLFAHTAYKSYPEAFVRVGHGIIVFPGGVGTAEEILYLLGVLVAWLLISKLIRWKS